MTTEWTPVKTKAYVPPNRRAEEKKNAPPEFDNGLEFPELVATPNVVHAWSTSKVSFTQTIHNLIALEQQTEAEREAIREAQREMEGWWVLSVKPFTPERYIEFNERMSFALKREREYFTMMNIGYHKTPEDLLRFDDDFSDSCSEDMSDGCSISDDESE
jgi:hypothetical protein